MTPGIKSAVIICDGVFPQKEYPRYLIRQADYIICCDAALKSYLRHCQSIFGKDRKPDAVIGDLDSISPSLVSKYSDIIIHETEQENNDQTKAFKFVLSKYKDATEIHIIGATGKRADHTIGNVSLLMEYARRFESQISGKSVDMVTDYETIFAITDSIELHCGKGRTVSIFSPDNSLRIKSSGLVWKTDDVVFDNWWKATLNKASDDIVKRELSHKSIALIMLN